MKKSLTFLLLTFLLSNAVKAQTTSSYANNWIDTTLQYAKIIVNKTGLYNIEVKQLSTILPGLVGANPDDLNLFFRGRSMAFEVIASGATLKDTDRIVFYGIQNDGALEKELYRPVNAQPHSFSSIYTKESNYYLCFDKKNPRKQRVKNEVETVDAAAVKVSTHNFVDQKVYDSDWSFNTVVAPIPLVQQSYFEPGEGYTGVNLAGAGKENTFDLTVTDQTRNNATLEIVLNGRNSDYRIVKIKVANKDTSVVVNGFDHRTIRIPIIIPSASFKLTLSSQQTTVYSLSLSRLTYEAKPSNLLSETTFNVGPGTAPRVFQVNQSNKQLNPTLYNITDLYNVKKPKFSGLEAEKLNYLISGSSATQNFYYNNDFSTPTSVTLFDPKGLKLIQKADYLIVTNKILETSAKVYKEFRESVDGESFKVETVYMNDLFDHFNYGIKSPQAIKNYLKLKLAGGFVQHMLLIGKAFSAHTGINGAEDLVPSMGYPASDLLLSSGIITPIDVNGVSTGRLPALTNQEVLNYLAKLKRNLKLPNDLSRKNMFHFSGGFNSNEVNAFGKIMDDLAITAKNSDFDVNLESKRKPTGTRDVISANLASRFNEGLSFAGYFGHSEYVSLDYNPGFVSNPELGFNNKRCPVLIYNGCAYNNYFREIKTQSADWIFAADKGALGILGQTYFGYETFLKNHARNLYETLFYSDVEPTLGEALRIAAEKNFNSANFGEIDALTNAQNVLFGDPAIKIFGFDSPDLLIDTVSFKTEVVGNTRKISFKLINTGKKINADKVSIKVVQEGLPTIIEKTIETKSPKLFELVTIELPNVTILKNLIVSVDSDNKVNETNEANNIFELNSALDKNKNGDLEGPFAAAKLDDKDPYDMMVVSNKPVLTVLVKDNKPLVKNGKNNSSIIGFTKSCEDCVYQKLDVSKLVSKVSFVDSSTALYNIQLGEFKPGEHFLLFYAADSLGNVDYNNPINLSFMVIPESSSLISLIAFPNPSTRCVTFKVKELSSYVSGKVDILIASVAGIKIAQWEEKAGSGTTDINYCFDSPGVYTYRIKTSSEQFKGETYSGKIIIGE